MGRRRPRTRRRAAEWRGRAHRPCRPRPAVGWTAAPGGPQQRDPRAVRRRSAGFRLHRVRGLEPCLRQLGDAPLLHIAERAVVDGRFRNEHAGAHRREGAAGSRRLQPRGLRNRSALVYLGGRDPSADVDRVRRGLNNDGANPAVLYGYGAYELPSDPMFDSARLSLLDRGLVFAIAHVRGGGEMGRQWYEDGKFLSKTNTFDDFIACAVELIDRGYTNPRQLAIRGRSAGGLLIGAVVNARPDLFACAVAQVPFVDALTTMLDKSIPLTVNEYEEWGDPNDPEFYEYMK